MKVRNNKMESASCIPESYCEYYDDKKENKMTNATAENTVTGVVERKGDKYNGSVLVNGNWLNFKKGVDHSVIVVGETYVFDLKDWEFKGKTGQSIVSFTHKVDIEVPATETVTVPVLKYNGPVPTVNSRNFAEEARGKTRCQMFSAALQSPVLQQYFYTKEMTLEQILETVQQVADEGTKYTFGEI